MKERKLQITGQSQAQMLTLDAELKLLANNWRRVGVKITINNKFIPEQQLREAPDAKRQAPSATKRPQLESRIKMKGTENG